MPWEHCGTRVLDNFLNCPVCGVAKERWTVRLERSTHKFVLGDAFAGESDAQAEALDDAADAGSPFCEECQAAANAPEEEGEEESEEPAADPDAEAQAEVLEGAAESGSPFCEECQREANAGA